MKLRYFLGCLCILCTPCCINQSEEIKLSNLNVESYINLNVTYDAPTYSSSIFSYTAKVSTKSPYKAKGNVKIRFSITVNYYYFDPLFNSVMSGLRIGHETIYIDNNQSQASKHCSVVLGGSFGRISSFNYKCNITVAEGFLIKKR